MAAKKWFDTNSPATFASSVRNTMVRNARSIWLVLVCLIWAANALIVPWRYSFDVPGRARGPRISAGYSLLFVPPSKGSSDSIGGLTGRFWSVQIDGARWAIQTTLAIALSIPGIFFVVPRTGLGLTSSSRIHADPPLHRPAEQSHLDMARQHEQKLEGLANQLVDALECGESKNIAKLVRRIAEAEARYWSNAS